MVIQARIGPDTPSAVMKTIAAAWETPPRKPAMLATAATTKTATYQRGKTPFCAPRPAPSMPMTGKAKMPMTKTGQGKKIRAAAPRLAIAMTCPVRRLPGDPGRVPSSPRAVPMRATAGMAATEGDGGVRVAVGVEWHDEQRGEADEPGEPADGGQDAEETLVHGKLLVGGGGPTDLRMQVGVERAADEVEVVEQRCGLHLEQGDQLVAVALAPGARVEAEERDSCRCRLDSSTRRQQRLDPEEDERRPRTGCRPSLRSAGVLPPKPIQAVTAPTTTATASQTGRTPFRRPRAGREGGDHGKTKIGMTMSPQPASCTLSAQGIGSISAKTTLTPAMRWPTTGSPSLPSRCRARR